MKLFVKRKNNRIQNTYKLIFILYKLTINSKSKLFIVRITREPIKYYRK